MGGTGLSGICTRAVAVLLTAGLALSLAGAGRARSAEVITDFSAHVAVGSDGSLRVSESIRVLSEGKDIRRGIYRDIPIRFRDRSGRVRENSLDVRSVSRNGAAEPYRVESGGTFKRIWIGDADVLLPPGPHTYVLVYDTDRQVRFFDAHDELFWNVTGNAWAFPILSATATVDLPGTAEIGELVYFTGPVGATGKTARGSLTDEGRRAVVTTTATLPPGHGLTVGVTMAKGVIAPPDRERLVRWFWRDHRNAIMSYGTLAAVFAYYLFAWWRVGRDPPRGVVVPRWDAPDGISPALTHYIENRGFRDGGWTALSAAVIDLAVKGVVTLDGVSETLVIRQVATAAPADLPKGEAELSRTIGTAPLRLDTDGGPRVQRVRDAFVQAIEREHRSIFYRKNFGWVVPGVGLTTAGVLLLLTVGDISESSLAALAASTVAAIALIVVVVKKLRAFRRTGLFGRIFMILAVAVGAIVVLAGALTQGAALLPADLDPVLVSALAGLAMTNAVFYLLMGAPTPVGRRMMDGIEGLKLYLELAERDRMNLAGAPQMSPRHFETLLPFAVALGLERPWSEAFRNWFASAAAGTVAAGYHPAWYLSSDTGFGRIGERMGSLGTALSESFTASLPVAETSSSGFSAGGGFSGGGGGGGGGGGW